jgi:hypothetical protein
MEGESEEERTACSVAEEFVVVALELAEPAVVAFVKGALEVVLCGRGEEEDERGRGTERRGDGERTLFVEICVHVNIDVRFNVRVNIEVEVLAMVLLVVCREKRESAVVSRRAEKTETGRTILLVVLLLVLVLLLVVCAERKSMSQLARKIETVRNGRKTAYRRAPSSCRSLRGVELRRDQREGRSGATETETHPCGPCHPRLR